MEGMDMFGVRQLTDVIFLISDGGDNSSHTPASALKKRLLSRGPRLYSLMAVEKFNPREEGDLGVDGLVRLSRDTGGKSMTFESLSPDGAWDSSPRALTLDRDMGKYVYLLAASGYELEIDMSRVKGNSVALKLKIVANDGKDVRNLQTLYPPRLAVCANTETTDSKNH
jgi:hypothetical protein